MFVLLRRFKENIYLQRKGRTDKEKKKNIWPTEERTGWKGNIYLDKENIWSTEEKKIEEGKGGKHLKKENIWSAEEKKNE